ncbi:MAG TPA: NosD domain-containing protein [Oscillatoriaceae cyanobacterium]
MLPSTPPVPVVHAERFASIQDAIDSLPPSGGTVVLQSRTYAIAHPLTVPSHVALRGQGDATVLRLSAHCDAPAIVNAHYGGGSDRGIRLSGLAIDGNRAQQETQMPLVFLDHVSACTLDHLTVQHGIADGVQLRHADHVVIRDGRFCDNGLTDRWVASGIALNGECNDDTITHNVCSHNNFGRNWALYPDDGNGIRIGDDCARNTVTFNVCDDNGRRGIKVQGAFNAVTDNTLAGNTGHSLLVGGLVCQGNLIARNHIRAHDDAAMLITAAATPGDGTYGNIVRDNVLEGGTYGIEVGWGAHSNQLIGNVITGAGLHGIFLRGSSQNLVASNRISDSGTRVSANAIDIQAYGGRPALHNVVKFNRCTDQRKDKRQAFGVKTEPGCDYTQVFGNDLRGNRFSPGLQLSGPHDRAWNNQD